MVETSEIKTGKKQTEVGSFPEDWQMCRIGDLANCYSGGTPNTSNQSFYGNDIPFITSGELNQRRIRKTEKGITERGLENSSAKIIEAGTLLIAMYGATAGVSAISEIKGAINQAVLAINTKKDVKKEYVFHWLQQNKERIISIYTQGGQPNLSGSLIKRILISLPSTKAEQAAIATALSDMDTLIEAQEKLIAKKRAIKEGAMQELLRPKEGWDVSELQDLADVIDPHPSHRAPKMQNSGVPFVGIGDLSKNGDIIGDKLRIVDYQIFEEHKLRYNLSHQLIGLGRVASIGKVVRLQNISEPYTISPTLGIIDAKKSSHEYLYHILNSKFITDQLERL